MSHPSTGINPCHGEAVLYSLNEVSHFNAGCVGYCVIQIGFVALSDVVEDYSVISDADRIVRRSPR